MRAGAPFVRGLVSGREAADDEDVAPEGVADTPFAPEWRKRHRGPFRGSREASEEHLHPFRRTS